jgi:hypothetical protein
MKTPQEEAEALLAPIAINSWSKSEVRNAIPLAQLIAVARAAKKVVQNAEGELLIDTYFNKEGAELLAALQSLRATGNVTL